MSEDPPDKRATASAPAEFKPAGAPGDDPLTRNLKRVYAEVAAEPIPKHLLDLLKKLDSADGEGGADA